MDTLYFMRFIRFMRFKSCVCGETVKTSALFPVPQFTVDNALGWSKKIALVHFTRFSFSAAPASL